MATATARAEARRRAIMARGNDRLAKLTTSARSEDPSAPERFTPEPASRPSSVFLGEDTSSMPATPPRQPASRLPSESPFRARTTSGPSAFAQNAHANPGPSPWSDDQQQQFMSALMGAGLGGEQPPLPQPPNANGDPFAAMLSMMQQGPDQGAPNANGADPFGAMLSMMQQGQGQGAPNANANANGTDPFGAMLSMMQQGQSQGQGAPMPMPPPAATRKPPSLVQRLLPAIHILSVWALLAYFVFWREPAAFAAATHNLSASGAAARWGELLQAGGAWSVQAVPFFYAFTTLELVLFSIRVFAGIDQRPPPFLLQLALPHLPAPIPALITNGLRYAQMAGVIADDLAALVVGLGLIVWFGAWVGSWGT